MTHTETSKSIQGASRAARRAIVATEKSLRQRHPWLEHQDLIGGSILAGALAGMIAMAAAYGLGLAPGWLAVPVIAVCMSLIHEIEHDLIHDLYFKNFPRLHRVAMGVVWLAKLHVNPYWRRKAHLRHHLHSGQDQDWEERLLGLGAPLGWRRLTALFSPFGQFVFFKELRRSDPEFRVHETIRANLPAASLFTVIMLGGLVSLTGLIPESSPLAPIQRIFAFLCVVWALPSILRHVALTLVTTACHYAGDIPRHEVHFQNQILDHWLLLPAHLFCFNFGATHIIHHYVTNQPFYLRQWLAKPAHAAILAAGGRRNDLAILGRANRFGPSALLRDPASDGGRAA